MDQTMEVEENLSFSSSETSSGTYPVESDTSVDKEIELAATNL